MATSPTLLRQLAPLGDKTQLVRLLDVFVFGPLMIVAAKDVSDPVIAIGWGLYAAVLGSDRRSEPNRIRVETSRGVAST